MHEPEELRYILELKQNAAGTGYFAPRPERMPDLSVALDLLRRRRDAGDVRSGSRLCDEIGRQCAPVL